MTHASRDMAWLVVMLLVGSWLLCGGCEEKGGDEPPPAWPVWRGVPMSFWEDLSAAEDDDARWDMLIALYEPLVARSGHNDVESYLKGVLTLPSPDTEQILARFPGAVSRLPWSQRDIRRIGSRLGSPNTLSWDVTEGDYRVYYSYHMTFGDVSCILLQELTGVAFESSAEFEAWIQEHGIPGTGREEPDGQ